MKFCLMVELCPRCVFSRVDGNIFNGLEMWVNEGVWVDHL